MLQRLAGQSLKNFAPSGRNEVREFEEHVCFLFEGRLQGLILPSTGVRWGRTSEPGEFCGELGLFDGGAQPEYVIALAAVVAVFIPSSELREIMLKTPHVIEVMGAKLAAKVRQLLSAFLAGAAQ